MKNDSDYLWEKTGEPDPDIQQLEEILGTLRYQPRPLQIPAGLAVGLSVGRERNFFRSVAPRLAIAATIAMLLIGLGAWVAWQRSQRKQPSLAQSPKAAVVPGVKSSPDVQPLPKQDQNSEVATAPKAKETTEPQRHRVRVHQSFAVNRSLVAVNRNRTRNEARRAKEHQEAVAAKDQLLLALRVVSAKLSFAQRKTQTPNVTEPVHNQHKIG